MTIDKENIPQHIAIIMDGNGRWAKKKLLPRAFGHREGVKAVEKTLEAAAKIGVKFLTLYAFSTENWGRPKDEVSALMQLLVQALDKYQGKLQRNNISLCTIGDYKKFPVKVVEKLERVVENTATNDGLTLILAVNYSGRWEITEAVKKIAEQIKRNECEIEQITDDLIDKSLCTYFAPEPDLIIRTSGEKRLSNFLLWQSAYTELYFTEQLWPDFNEKSLIEAIEDYQKRERRFGAL